MDTFDFPYHLVSTINPDSGARVALGGSYVFTSAPTAPNQRTFTLTFAVMQYFVDGSGNPEATTNAQYNMKTLDDFYLAHLLHVSFIYPHPIYGDMEVKFLKPLTIPDGIGGGNGTVKQVTVELVEIP